MRLGNFFRVMLIALFVCFVAQAASVQKRWIFLGDKHVDGHDDHDKISIGSKEGTFRQLQIRVKVAPVILSAPSFISAMALMKSCSLLNESMPAAQRGHSICAAPIE